MNETPMQWRPCPDQPDYEIREDGMIRRMTKAYRGRPAGFVLRPRLSNTGYLQIDLGPKSARRAYFVHRLVARAFIGEAPTDDHVVAHNDGRKTHNHFSNLRWATQRENLADQGRHGTAGRGYQQRNYSGSIAPLPRSADGKFWSRRIHT